MDSGAQSNSNDRMRMLYDWEVRVLESEALFCLKQDTKQTLCGWLGLTLFSLVIP